MRAAAGIAAGFTGTAKSSSRRSDRVAHEASCGEKLTAGPSGSGLPGAAAERSPAQPSVAENAGIAHSSLRAKAPGGTESDAFARLAAPLTVVVAAARLPVAPSPDAHVGGLASARTSMGSVPVVGAASVGRCTLTTSVVFPGASASTEKSNDGWRRSSGADAGAFATVPSPTAKVAVTAAQRSGSTTRRTGRDCPGASTVAGGSKCTFTVGAVVGSHTSPGKRVVVGGGLLAGGLEDELH